MATNKISLGRHHLLQRVLLPIQANQVNAQGPRVNRQKQFHFKNLIMAIEQTYGCHSNSLY